MNTIQQRLAAGFGAVVASSVTLGVVVGLFASVAPADPLHPHLPGGAGVAERYRGLQPVATETKFLTAA